MKYIKAEIKTIEYEADGFRILETKEFVYADIKELKEKFLKDANRKGILRFDSTNQNYTFGDYKTDDGRTEEMIVRFAEMSEKPLKIFVEDLK